MSELPNINEAFEKPVGGYGRIWESMYKGSMMGAGLEVFAVWPYVIANMRGHPEHGALVELNPMLLAFMIGCEQGDIERAIMKLCADDPESRTPREDGKRLVKLGQFLYRVVNGGEYLAVRKAEADKLKNREAVARHRDKRRRGSVPRGTKATTAAERLRMTTDDPEVTQRLEELEAKVPPGSFDEPEPPGQVEGPGPEPGPALKEADAEAVARVRRVLMGEGPGLAGGRGGGAKTVEDWGNLGPGLPVDEGKPSPVGPEPEEESFPEV